jgi:hypothetical protein
MAQQLCKYVQEFTKADLEDKESELWARAIEGVRMLRSQDAQVVNERSLINQWEEAVKNAATTATSNVLKLHTKSGMRIDKALVGDIKKRIHARKKRDLGVAEKSIESLDKHYKWLVSLISTLSREGVVPQWLR